MMKKLVLYLFAVVTFAAYCSIEAKGQADFADFTYQGSLTVGGVPANGNYELTFEYFSTQTGGTTLGTFVFSGVTVTNGIFSVELPGSTSLFAPGASIWIQISAKPAGSPDAPTILTPRQRVQPSPMSISSLLSADSNKLGGVAANQYLTTTGAATTFIQNGTTQQTGGFNLNGTGTANILNAASQFNINGNRILSASGADNIFAGFQAGQSNTSGSSNAFFGVLAGSANTTGNFNSFFGRSTGISNSGGNAVFSGNVGIGTTSPNSKFELIDSGNTGLRVQTNTAGGTVASFGGLGAFRVDAPGFVGGRFTMLENGNVGIGNGNPSEKLSVTGNGVFTGIVTAASGSFANLSASNGAFTGNLRVFNKLTVNVGIDYFDSIGNANFFMKGAGAANGINFGVAGNAGSNSTLYISQYDGTTYQDRLILNNTGSITMPTTVSIGSDLGADALIVTGRGVFNIGTDVPDNGPVCSKWVNGNPFTSRLVECGVSSIRHKSNVNNLSTGLSIIKNLRPVTFNWKVDNSSDFGFIAEEVEKVEPRLTMYNENKEVEGVRYDKIGTILVKAMQEQQTQIEEQKEQIGEQTELIRQQQEKLEVQQREIERQRNELEALKKLVCGQNPTAVLCQPKK